MTCCLAMLAVFSLLAVEPEGASESTVSAEARWGPVFDRVARQYELHVGLEPSKLELLSRPVYRWARPGPNGGTSGAVYVWTRKGCAEAVACFWRSAPDGKDLIAHELHSLSSGVLESDRGGPNQWRPEAVLKRQLVPGAPAPASSPGARLQQMRTLSRDFSSSSVSSRGERTELRLLPQPLFRYDSTSTETADGALFAFVCSVGTDPEIFLLIESIETNDGLRWHYALARFSHLNLFVNHKEQPVWQSVRNSSDTIGQNSDKTYWLFHEPFDRAN
jgi:hypothetical protein